MTPVELVLSRVTRAKQHRGYWKARCPAHQDDSNDSLAIKEGADGKALLNCHAGCQYRDVIAALGLTDKDLFPQSNGSAPAEQHITHEYIYRGVDGDEHHRTLRYGPKKEFRQARVIDGAYCFSLGKGIFRKKGKSWVPCQLSDEGATEIPETELILYKLGTVKSAIETKSEIFLCEGEKDVDAINEFGGIATCNPQGAGKWKESYTDALAGATMVTIIRDKDKVGKDHARLVRRFLDKAGIPCRVVESAAGKDAHDHLLAGFKLDDFVEVEIDQYLVLSGKTFRRGRKGESKYVNLSNFSAQIVKETILDDGAQPRIVLEIEGECEGRTARFEVTPEEFGAVTWPIAKLGARAIVSPSHSARSEFRAAIQELSNPQVQRVFAHTGWTTIDGKPAYLTGSGAITKEGLNKEVTVDLARTELGRYEIAPQDADQGEIWRKLLNIAPLHITAVLLGTAAIAPLVTGLDDLGYKPNYVVWCHGGSGTYKSSAVALYQSLWGKFTDQTLPANFLGTENYIERQWFCAKDALLTVDDWYPASDRKDQSRMRALASKILRSAGNNASRGRMNADTTTRKSLQPRGMLIVTAENEPEGHSDTARAYPILFSPSDVDIDLLTQLQSLAHDGAIAGAMFGYLKWLAANYDDTISKAARLFVSGRAKLDELGHARQRSSIAFALAGIATLGRYLAESKIWTPDTYRDVFEACAEALKETAANEAGVLIEERPEQIFLRLIQQGMRLGNCHLTLPDGNRPGNADRWGWVQKESGTYFSWFPGGQKIGWIAKEHVHLSPDIAYGYVCEAMLKHGRSFPCTQRALWRRMSEAGISVVSAESQEGRSLHVWKHDGSTMRVCRIKLEQFQNGLPEELAQTSSTVTQNPGGNDED